MDSLSLLKRLFATLTVWSFVGIVLITPGCSEDQPSATGETNAQLSRFIGSPARLAWVQDLGDNKDVHAVGNQLALMGYDSQDGKGERVILAGPENFILPLITPSGKQVVFSDYQQRLVQAVDWSGKNRHNLTHGLALAVWRDPADGTQWVYVGRDPNRDIRGNPMQRLYRVQLDNPAREELVWDQGLIGGAIHLSADGRYFSAEMPWPACGIVDLEQKASRRIGTGCWPAMSPDLTNRFWFFDGAHRNLEMVDTMQGTRNRIHIAGAAGIDGQEVYHPRWSNHPRYLVMTGPYTSRPGGNNIAGGGAGIEIYVGRFNEDFSGVEQWLQVTGNRRADYYPDLWVADRNVPHQDAGLRDEPAQDIATPVAIAGWPVVNEQLLFAWENGAAKNSWTGPKGSVYQSKMVPEGRARFGLNYRMSLGEGWYVADRSPAPAPKEYRGIKTATLEFVIDMPERGLPVDGRLLSLGGGNGVQLIVHLMEGALVLEEAVNEQTLGMKRAGRLPAGRSHVLLQVEQGKTVLSINGDRYQHVRSSDVGLTAWPITVGDPASKKGQAAAGSMERLALYTGLLKKKEIAHSLQNVEQIIENRPTKKPIIVRAELVSASRIPLPEDILPYRRGLVVNEYRVTEILQGKVENEAILVAHWVILDGEPLAGSGRKVGNVYRLQLDLFDDRPELEGERLSMDSENLLLPMYYDLGL